MHAASLIGFDPWKGGVLVENLRLIIAMEKKSLNWEIYRKKRSS